MPATQREIALLNRLFSSARVSDREFSRELTRLRNDGYTPDELDRPMTKIIERDRQ